MIGNGDRAGPQPGARFQPLDHDRLPIGPGEAERAGMASSVVAQQVRGFVEILAVFKDLPQKMGGWDGSPPIHRRSVPAPNPAA